MKILNQPNSQLTKQTINHSFIHSLIQPGNQKNLTNLKEYQHQANVIQHLGIKKKKRSERKSFGKIFCKYDEITQQLEQHICRIHIVTIFAAIFI